MVVIIRTLNTKYIIEVKMKLLESLITCLRESEDEYLYHATYGARIKSIKQHGLLTGKKKNWDDSKKHVIYLATDPDVAHSYAESSDIVPDEWLDNIKILKVKKSNLDKTKLKIDSNVIDNDGSTVEYHDNIPPHLLKIHPY